MNLNRRIKQVTVSPQLSVRFLMFHTTQIHLPASEYTVIINGPMLAARALGHLNGQQSKLSVVQPQTLIFTRKQKHPIPLIFET